MARELNIMAVIVTKLKKAYGLIGRIVGHIDFG